jgi:hypothetical protein
VISAITPFNFWFSDSSASTFCGRRSLRSNGRSALVESRSRHLQYSVERVLPRPLAPVA